MLSKEQAKRIKLLQNSKHRYESGLFVAEGKRLVDELIQSDLEIIKGYFTSSWISTMTSNGVNFQEISTQEMEKISNLTTPTEVLVVVRIPTYTFSLKQIMTDLVLILDRIQDPGNLGSILRIANWFGIKHVICSNDTVDAFSPKVVQSSMGAIAKVQVFYRDIESVIKMLNEEGISTYGTFLDGENIFHSNLTQNGAIVLGNEGNGISNTIERLIQNRITIPSYPEWNSPVESLNVAMATAVVCAEFRRRVNP